MNEQNNNFNGMPSPEPQVNNFNNTPSPEPQVNNFNNTPSPEPQVNNFNNTPSPEPQVNNFNSAPSPEPQVNNFGGINNTPPQNQWTPTNNNPMHPEVNLMGNQPHKNKIVLPLILVVVGIAIFAITLGGNKTLVCTDSESMSGLDMELEITMNFKANKFSNAKGLITVDIGEYSDYKDVFIKGFEEELDDYKEKGIDVAITSDNQKIYVEFSADKENFITNSETYDLTKSELEKMGYTCK